MVEKQAVERQVRRLGNKREFTTEHDKFLAEHAMLDYAKRYCENIKHRLIELRMWWEDDKLQGRMVSEDVQFQAEHDGPDDLQYGRQPERV